MENKNDKTDFSAEHGEGSIRTVRNGDIEIAFEDWSKKKRKFNSTVIPKKTFEIFVKKAYFKKAYFNKKKKYWK